MVKIGLRSSPPLFLMSSRFIVAGLALLLLARWRRTVLPASLAAWRPIAVLGVLNYALYLGLTAIALRHVSAGMGAVLASTNPLMLALVAAWLLDERLTVPRVVGLLTSFAGVVWVMASRIGPDNEPGAMGLMVVSIASLVAGTLLFKRAEPRVGLLVLNGGQLLVAGLVLAAPVLVWEDPGAVRLTASFLAAQTYLIVGVSWVGMLIWFWLLRHGDATRASAYFFLNPIFGIFLGALLLNEPLDVRDFLGGAVVALGIWLVQRG